MAPLRRTSLAIVALCAVGSLRAAPAVSSTVSTTPTESVDQQLRVTENSRTQELRDAVSQCARRAEQARRLADPSYRKFAESLTLPQALAIYTEVQTRLQSLYFDRDKATIERMYRGSLAELTTALGQSHFAAERQSLEPLIRAAALLAPREVGSSREAIKALALAGKKLSNVPVGLIVLEAAQGCCAELDDYTLYLHPGNDDDAAKTAPAVSSVETLRDSAHPEQPAVGYLRVAHFGQSLPQELDAAMTRLRETGAKSLVLDLRGVPGGLLQAAVQSAERFLPRGAIATARGQQTGANKTYAAPGAATCELPLVVLVNSETASAAEVLAAALKDRDRAVLIGQTTYGKGAVQQVIPLEAGGHLRLTLARLFGPDGRSFHDIGITPTISESQPERQLELAIREAAKLAERKAG